MVTRTTEHTEWRVINEETGAKMGYRYLGRTGIKVSIVSYGNWLTSDADTTESQMLVTESIKRCWEAGVNFFDTAEMYACGKAETQMGISLKHLALQRKDYVLSTKMWHCGNMPNDRFLSRKHIIEGLRNSLKRLQVSYVDVVFAHRPDYETPLEEQVRAFSWCIDQGMALYWGTSEWPAAMIEQACAIAEKYNLHLPQVEQCQYNMFVRDKMESEYRTLFETRQMGTTIWSPLYGGALAGKYNDGTLPEGSRGQEAMNGSLGLIKPRWYKYFGAENIEKTKAVLQGIAQIAKDLGYSQAQLALAWTLVLDDTSTCILGFSRVTQIDENLKCLEVISKWTPEIELRVNEILGNAPEMPTNFRTGKPMDPRRPH